jgi:hypothetical protein
VKIIKAIKPVLILLVLTSSSVIAEEECIFDETAYINFINEYKSKNKNAIIKPEENTLKVKRNGETILVNGGGCVHLGMTIKLRSKKVFSEKEFLQKTLSLSSEFGNWLINTKALKESIENGHYQKIDNVYFIKVDAMTVFEAFFNNKGEINISFYIN